MADQHPAIVLFILSGLLVFWLTPISAWWMLSGQPNRNARIWFLGTALYALVATLFAIGKVLPLWVLGPFSNILGLGSLICMFEALRREISQRPTPYRAYGLTILFQQTILNIAFFTSTYTTAGIGIHLLLLSLVEIGLIMTVEYVRRFYKSRALWLVTSILALFALSNTVRVAELWSTGRLPMLLDFTALSNASLILNYVSVVFYCYGYWGFIVEKNRTLLEKAAAEAMEARANELIAIQQEELTRAESKFRADIVQRMAEIGKIAQSAALSGSIAHEINQPLTSMMLSFSVLRRQINITSPGHDISERLLKLEQDARRIASIVRRIKAIFEQKEPSAHPNTIDNVLGSSIELLKDDLVRQSIEVRKTLNASITFVFAADEIEHVFLNVLQNSIDALQHQDIPRLIDVHSWTNDAHVFVAIADNGPGIPSGLGQSIFALRETSKEHGTGLGLWLAHYIINRNGGKISLDETHYSGARILIQLPITYDGRSEI